MSVNFNQIGRRVKEIRRAKGMSQAELAEQIDMSVPYISLIETATKKASLSTLILIANALGVTVIIDLYSRKVISYKILKKHSTQLITATFKKAFKARQPERDLTFHSDRGVQYAAYAFRNLLISLGVTQSFSPSGKPCHNAVMESFFASLKKEELYRVKYRSVRDFEESINEYMMRYNNERPHVTLRYKTPNAYEQAYFDQQKG